MEPIETKLGPLSALQLFVTSDSETQLVGGRCVTCGSIFFPQFAITHKVGCTSAEIEQVLLGPVGVVSSYTTQHYAPPPPFPVAEPFEPFSVISVAFPEGIEVVGRLLVDSGDEIRIGLNVRLTQFEMRDVSDGSTVETWAFQLATEGTGD